MSCSKDLREEAAKYRKAVHILRETSEIFGAGETSISRCEEQYDRTEDLSDKELHRQARKLPPEKVAAYQEKIADIPPEKIVYVDETGLDQFYAQEYAYAPRGKTVEGLVPGKKFQRVNLTAAQMGHEVCAPIQYKGTPNAALFEFWFNSACCHV